MTYDEAKSRYLRIKHDMIETLKIQLEQQIKNNKNLDQLCESLKIQMKT